MSYGNLRFNKGLGSSVYESLNRLWRTEQFTVWWVFKVAKQSDIKPE